MPDFLEAGVEHLVQLLAFHARLADLRAGPVLAVGH
jgi:hypothetical protein